MRIYVYAENHPMSGRVALPPDPDMAEQWAAELAQNDDVVLWEGTDTELIADANRALRASGSYYSIKAAHQVLDFLGAE